MVEFVDGMSPAKEFPDRSAQEAEMFSRITVPAIFLLAFASVAIAEDRHQSYISYDDGGSLVISAGDGQQIEGRVNLPLFSGDELRTGRRGRTEVRLADGNVIAVDRDSRVRFRSVYGGYEDEGMQTVVAFDGGAVMVHRLQWSDQPMRLDSSVASYVASRESLFSVDSDGRGRDIVTVFAGSMEIRTPRGQDRLRAGEQARVDQDGVYSTVRVSTSGGTDFERWYLGRSGRYDRTSSRYLDDRFSYAHHDLDGYGNWVYVNDYSSYVWRPTVSIGWRPYHHGRWITGPRGHLIWHSYEPWGWMPYHYGRWTLSAHYGWVWIPGAVYSPAWVYWVYGPTYVGWIPAGFYDCYGPYYRWHPRARYGMGFGFHGRVRLSGIDLTPWTFVQPDRLVSHRIDQAALTTDAVRNRLTRDGDRATVTSTPARFTGNDLRDPASAIGRIAREGVGGGTGRGDSGAPADLTAFIRRDPELPAAVRERIARPEPAGGAVAGRAGAGEAVTGRASGAGAERSGVVGRGGAADVITRQPAAGEGGAVQRPAVQRPATGEGTTVRRPAIEGRDSGGSNPVEARPRAVERPAVERPQARPAEESNWRSRPTTDGRVMERGAGAGETRPVPRTQPAAGVERPQPSTGAAGNDWRSRGGAEPRSPAASRPSGNAVPRDETPRRVIDRIRAGEDAPAATPRPAAGTPRPAAATTPAPESSRPAPTTERARPAPSRSSDDSSGSARSTAAPARSSDGDGSRRSGAIRRD
jgi:hypothetical protein